MVILNKNQKTLLDSLLIELFLMIPQLITNMFVKHKKETMMLSLQTRNMKELFKIGLNTNLNGNNHIAKKNLIRTTMIRHAFTSICGALT